MDVSEPAFYVGEKVFVGYGGGRTPDCLGTILSIEHGVGGWLYEVHSKWFPYPTHHYADDLEPLPPLERLAYLAEIQRR